ncbi:MAG TPA: SDR family oxidoreductase [Magnetospirillaceae bacterium]|nr:SDR family oxidoreductase [Magnetospirillaceae bacterium]
MTDQPTRRHLLGAATAGAAGLALGAAATAATIKGAAPVTIIERTNRQRFADKVVAITGATSGIGRAAALAFAAEGAKVAFCGRREALGHEVEAEIAGLGGQAFYIRADVRKEEDVKAFVDAAVAKYGKLDVAFNNAGITLEKRLHDYTAAEWDDVVHTDLRGVFLSMKYEIPYLLTNGGGTIVVTASTNALAAAPRRGAYAAAKHGLIGLVQAAALDYAEQGIRINALVPGTTDTALVRRVAGMEDAPEAVWQIGAQQWAKSNIPGMKRMARPEEIAAVALMLASDDYSYMTGSSVVVDGGKMAHGG